MQELEKTTTPAPEQKEPRGEYAHGVLAHVGRHMTWGDVLLLEAIWAAICLIGFICGETMPWGVGAVGILAITIVLLEWHRHSRPEAEKAAEKTARQKRVDERRARAKKLAAEKEDEQQD